jgi:plastocyanin
VRRGRSIALVLVAGAAALAAAPAPAGSAKKKKGPTKTIKLGDNYYAPDKVTVRRNTTIVWKWPDLTSDGHDVALEKGPKGARKFASEEAAAAYSYKRKLTVPGTYKIICTLHDEMKMTITVKK